MIRLMWDSVDPDAIPPGAAVFPRNAMSGGSLSPSSRETQSMEFFNTAVIELLYSGVAMSRAWWVIINCLSRFACSGSPLCASRSPS